MKQGYALVSQMLKRRDGEEMGEMVGTEKKRCKRDGEEEEMAKKRRQSRRGDGEEE